MVGAGGQLPQGRQWERRIRRGGGDRVRFIRAGGGEGDRCGMLQIGQSSTLITIGTKNNSSLSYVPGTEQHLTIMITLGGHKDWLERDR